MQHQFRPQAIRKFQRNVISSNAFPFCFIFYLHRLRSWFNNSAAGGKTPPILENIAALWSWEKHENLEYKCRLLKMNGATLISRWSSAFCDSPVHLGVQQGRGVLVYRGGPLIETKKGVRAPGNDIRQTCTDAVHIHSHSSAMEGICVRELR